MTVKKQWWAIIDKIIALFFKRCFFADSKHQESFDILVLKHLICCFNKFMYKKDKKILK